MSEHPTNYQTFNYQTFSAKLTNFGVIQISGEDNNKFLQGQLTINSESISDKKLSLAAICNLKGRCISLFFTFKINETIYLVLKQEIIPETLLTLKKYAVFFKVELLDVSTDYEILGFAKNSEFDEQLEPITHELESVYWFNPNIGLSIINKNKQLEKQSQILDESAWLFALAQNRIPWLTLETQGHFLPHHLDLPKLLAVDFKKGCFTGQEVIARMQYKGKLKSRMQLFSCKSLDKSERQARLQEHIRAKEHILSDGKNVAEIICTASIKNQETLILAVMKDTYLDHKTFLLSDKNASILKLLTY